MRKAAGGLLAGSLICGLLATGIAGASAPMTKEEYFQKSLEVYTAASKANSAYYDLPYEPIAKKRCARRVERIADRSQRAVSIAAAVEPPAEIAELHAQLLAAGGSFVRKTGQTADRVRAGRVRCEGASSKLYRVYLGTGLDEIEAQLMELGYVPSGY